MTTVTLDLRPLDVWSIRDGRPFDVGGIVHARALWPPSPWTVLGAIRTLLCETLGTPGVVYGSAADPGAVPAAVREVVGAPGGPPPFRLGPVLLAGPDGPYWPVPADVVTLTPREAAAANGDLARCRRLRLERSSALREHGAVGSGPREITLLPPLEGEARPDKSVALGSLTTEQLRAWLRGGDPPTSDCSPDSPVEREARIGIRIDPATGSVETGKFYLRTVLSIPADHRLLVPVAEPATAPWLQLDGQHLRLGADGHLATVAVVEDAAPWPAEAHATGERGTLLFLSPVAPRDLETLRAGDTPVEVLAVAAGRTVAIGGWQLRHDGTRQAGPRPLRRCYPPGTVAYVRTDGDLSTLHATSIATDADERAAGFGFCLAGAWPRN